MSGPIRSSTASRMRSCRIRSSIQVNRRWDLLRCAPSTGWPWEASKVSSFFRLAATSPSSSMRTGKAIPVPPVLGDGGFTQEFRHGRPPGRLRKRVQESADLYPVLCRIAGVNFRDREVDVHPFRLTCRQRWATQNRRFQPEDILFPRGSMPRDRLSCPRPRPGTTEGGAGTGAGAPTEAKWPHSPSPADPRIETTSLQHLREIR